MKDQPQTSQTGIRLEEAVAWRLRLAENDGRPTLAFDIWLQQDGNRAAWEQSALGWEVFAGMEQAPELEAIRQAALADAAGARRRLSWHRLARPLQAAAAVILLACMVGGGSWWWVNRPDDFHTRLGERRVVTLSDGSRLSLDSNSEVTVKYASHQRSLHLIRGQARFDVAHDRSRPFSVLAGNQRVIATGTAFNIDLAGSKVVVTLIEGHVVVLTGSGDEARGLPASERIELQAGQQLSTDAGKPARVTAANVPRVTAWIVGQLVFYNESLSSVVERVNRYSDTRIVITDPVLGDKKISGVFNAGDPQGFVDIVTRYLDMRAVPGDAHTIELRDVAR